MNIPTVDLNQYIFGVDSERSAFIQDLGSAFEQVGFVAVSNHGLSKGLMDALYEKTRIFFELPIDTKLTYEIHALHGQRGFTSFGKEHAKGSSVPDLKEFFQFGQVANTNGEYPDNVYVHDVDDFNHVFEIAFKQFEDSGRYLLQAIASYLSLASTFFDEYVFHGNSILRAIFYPPITAEPSTAIRAEQHEDINLITLLMGASSEGLQILMKNGRWMPVVTDSDRIVVNVGDMLQRLTNDRLKSTTHRVVNPPREGWHLPRFSIPFFLHPISSMSLSCLHSCVSASRPRMYEDITAGEYLDERLREIGLKK